jgi:hypothetical protein
VGGCVLCICFNFNLFVVLSLSLSLCALPLLLFVVSGQVCLNTMRVCVCRGEEKKSSV